MDTLKKNLGEITGITIGFVLLLMLEGVVLSHLWNWFIAKNVLFAQYIGTGQAMGILITAFMLRGFKYKKVDDEESMLEKFLYYLFASLFIWLIGYIIHLIIN